MRFFICILVIIIVASCSGDAEKHEPIDIKKMQEDLLQANKKAVVIESEQIDAYIKRKNLEIVKTQTGLRYQIYKDVEGKSIESHQKAAVKYTVTLLDGTECYSTKENTETFTVGKDYVESGLHEAILYMSIGDKATIIIPSHLAHGLAGDFEKIPFRSTIIYDIELVAIN